MADAQTAAGGPPEAGALARVGGFPVALDRLYHAEAHMWVGLAGTGAGPGGPARVGMDALGVETSGTLAQLSLPAVGERVTAGRPLGQLEAAKFVGPLISPVSGVVVAVNEVVAADPGLAERDPYGAGWLLEVRLSDPDGELGGLIGGQDEITAWFAAAVDDYRTRGVIAS